MNRRARKKLHYAEKAYLHANGWTLGADGRWSNKVLRRDSLDEGHAVNVQKQRDRWSEADRRRRVNEGPLLVHALRHPVKLLRRFAARLWAAPRSTSVADFMEDIDRAALGDDWGDQ
jgi:hypothetical protein